MQVPRKFVVLVNMLKIPTIFPNGSHLEFSFGDQFVSNYFHSVWSLLISDLGSCSPFDNLETDCGTNGECVTYTNEYGVNAAFCKCRNGYSGIRCDGKYDRSLRWPRYTRALSYMVHIRKNMSSYGRFVVRKISPQSCFVRSR